MVRTWAQWCLCGAVLLNMPMAMAADSIVQEFDGWKITITPGPSAAIPLPPSPAPPVKNVSSGAKTTGPVQLVSLRHEPEAATKPADPTPDVDQDDSPMIIPASPIAPPVTDARPSVLSYRSVYNSIPFSRAEYDANPSYRHDSTMEFLFGQLRPTVIHRGTTEVNHYYPNGYVHPITPVYFQGVGLRIHRTW